MTNEVNKERIDRDSLLQRPTSAPDGRPMADKALRTEFDERVSRAERNHELARGLVEDLRSVGGANRVAIAKMGKRIREARPETSRDLPDLPGLGTIKRRLFPNSLGFTIPPPYTEAWSTFQKKGTPWTNIVSNNYMGDLRCQIQTNVHHRSEAIIGAGVGIPIRPPAGLSVLRVWANVGLAYRWSSYCWDAGAVTTGLVALSIDEYDPNNPAGRSLSTVFDQQHKLWSDNSNWGNDGSYSTNAFPLTADTTVAHDFYYRIWVWCSVYAGSWGEDAPCDDYSFVDAALHVTVPAITWELL
jgi:hypothetical protein